MNLYGKYKSKTCFTKAITGLRSGQILFLFCDLAQIVKNKVLFLIISVYNKSYQTP